MVLARALTENATYFFCSLWDYTNIVMTFLCGAHTLDSSSTLNFEWLQYFDMVVTGRFCSSWKHYNMLYYSFIVFMFISFI
ncbi:hypothetical protein U1Q18_005820 [Sarracenia purpurea var. burkii]